MRPFALLLAALTLTACAAAELTADPGNLDGLWRFATDPHEVGEQQGWQTPEFDDSGWRELKVPGSWEPQGVTEPRPGKPPQTSATMRWTDYDGAAWYRLRVTVPAAWAGEELVLRLGGVDDQDRTFLNGTLVGETGPGLQRSVGVQRSYPVPAVLVRPGAENVIAIRVWDGGGPGGIDGPALTLWPRKEAERMGTLPQSDRPLAERFADPPAEARILKIIHGWPDDPASQDSLRQLLLAQGFGGVVCNVSFSDYLQSEPRWQAFVRAVNEAKRAGMALWLYDERGYPSGAAGGLVLKDHPEWEARGLLVAEAESQGGAVSLDLPPGTFVSAQAYPVAGGRLRLDGAVDLAGSVREGKLSWQAPAGAWRVMAVTESPLYEGTHAQLSLADKLPYINLMQPEPTRRFIELTHDQYAQRLGADLSPWFAATFTDEPSLMNWYLRPQPWRPLPWSPAFAAEFRQRRGYDLAPRLPALVADADGAAKVRHDFWRTVGELVSDHFFGQLQTWGREHGIPSGGHLLAEESLLSHVCLYGDFMACLRRLDAPSIDCLTSIPAQVPWKIARMTGSVADLEGRALTMCETSDHSQRYRPAGDTRPVVPVSEEDIRGTCNRLLLGGINTITSYYSFSGLSTAQIRRLNTWVGRCSTLLRGGHQVTDVALVYPIESVWPRFVPAKRGSTDSPDAQRIEAWYNGALDSLYQARRDPTIVDSRALAAATAEAGALRHGDLRWRVLVLPGVDTLPWAAWQRVERFWETGGLVIALGLLPANDETDFPSARVQALARKLFGDGREPGVTANAAGGAGVFLPAGAQGLLPLVLDAALEPDVRVADPGSPLRAAHRRVDGHDLWLLINDSGAPLATTVDLPAKGAGELYRPDTSEVAAVPSGAKLAVDLPPYGGVIYRFAMAREPQRQPLAAGELPGLTLSELPSVQPTAGKGEFVQAALEPDAGHATAARPAWRATGTLTKGAVDTFLFVGFDYPDNVDLTGAEGLMAEVWVPEGQQPGTQVLVIVQERDGGAWLASTGVPLGAAGHARAYVPFSSFRLMGHTQDANGRLDLDRVAGVRVGWGGYFGQEGERIAFSLAAPQVARRE